MTGHQVFGTGNQISRVVLGVLRRQRPSGLSSSLFSWTRQSWFRGLIQSQSASCNMSKRKVSDASLEEKSNDALGAEQGPTTAPSDDPARSKQKPRTGNYQAESLAPSAFSPVNTTSKEPPIVVLSYPDTGQINVKQTAFQMPTQIMSYSHDEQHAQKFDNSALRYYVDPPLGAHLDYGYDRWIRKPDERGRLDGLLSAISRLRKDPAKALSVPDNGLVCWRGIMTK